MTGKVYICKTCSPVKYFTFFKITYTAKNRCTRTTFSPGKLKISWANVCLCSSDLKHQMHICFSPHKGTVLHYFHALLLSRVKLKVAGDSVCNDTRTAWQMGKTFNISLYT